MTTQLPISTVHPTAPDHLSAMALFSAPIDVAAALSRVPKDTLETAVGLDHMDGGDVYHYMDSGVTVLVTPVIGEAEVGTGVLPPHAFHTMITLFSSMAREGADMPDPVTDQFAAQRRAAMVAVHRAYSRLIHALMPEPAAVGVAHPELGIVYPADVLNSLNDDARFLEWVYVAVSEGDATVGRTRGLPLFGHLDLQVAGSAHSGSDVYNMLANTAAYVILDSGTLMPGQTLGQSEAERLPISQGHDEKGEAILNISY
ncbi:DUF4261 domain-containing protein [Neoactinobaculum massilliense]|uniref:DUF4261 domain-containing protein n=1 Tax=Neoactinobaculum massilliense TaxID=2364794 RepID=UPI000F531532|nr:DUF4261 domain-containing protein [Neoactinobaculum massilliense]